MDGPGIESRWGRDFLHPSRPDLQPTQPRVQWAPGLNRGLSGRGVALTTHPPSSAEVKKRVELHLTPPAGVHCLLWNGLHLLSWDKTWSKEYALAS